ncbi:lysophospholipase [Belliella sp. DSM 111904]|uniref:Lysophospholipase n=1 Tax=Belliella filtrata TaxID=2923435 RepID=A0ABS9UZ97_9BACT|nr:alpha/beta hydrolase [Belliella filtrata]MCH7409482.1 lysophospholipase [Belliella filtrata]
MKLTYSLFFLFLFTEAVIAKVDSDTTFQEFDIKLSTTTGEIFGTLTIPVIPEKPPLAVIISGSGPTDRDGNNPAMKNNSLKMLAHGLTEKGIATLRFDKRGVGESQKAGKSEIVLRFEDYVNDVKDWISMLKGDDRFSSMTVIGHSEGALIGLIACDHADKFIGIAGLSESADFTLKRQLEAQPKAVQDLAFPILDSLKIGKTVDEVNPMLYSLFRPSVQPYLISWFQYDPQQIISKLTIPTLIVQGTNDLQVEVEDAEKLSRANPKAKLVRIENMNHVLKIVEGDRQVNLKAYNLPDLPISNKLIESIVNFIYGR